MPKSFYFLLFILVALIEVAQAQFAPAAGQLGSTALHRDSANWVGWATKSFVRRGYKDISQPALGPVASGSPSNALGTSDGLILSLGDGGLVELEFEHPIKNGQGPDFAVFENSFNNTFLELAFVEVSSDGQRFVRFPAISNTDTTTQVGSFGAVDPTQLYNLAGKYRASYGTPFDLEELRDSAGLDINAITHMRVIDVVGSINPAYGQRDSRGWLINDPWNTPFDSGGFDLDAVGVLHQTLDNSVTTLSREQHPVVYPNPVERGGVLFYKNTSTKTIKQLRLYNLQGQLVWHQPTPIFPLALPHLSEGLYLLHLQTADGLHTQRLTVRP